MSDLLLYLVLLGAMIAYAVGGHRRRMAMLRRNGEIPEGLQIGPMPGYTRLPGDAVKWDPTSAQPMGLGDTWRPRSVETLHVIAGRELRRVRIILSVEHFGLKATEVHELARDLAVRVQRSMKAHVVAVEAVPAHGGEPAALVYAPDGRGWTGTAENAAFSVHLPGREDFRLPAS